MFKALYFSESVLDIPGTKKQKVYLNDENIRLYTFAVLFADLLTPNRNRYWNSHAC